MLQMNRFLTVVIQSMGAMSMGWRTGMGLRVIAVCALTALAQAAYGQNDLAARPTPGAKVTLAPTKPVFLIGESVLVRYRLENTGKTSFALSLGNAPGFLARFTVTAGDQNGQQAPPSEWFFPFGEGLTATTELKPGETFTALLPLARLVRFEKPGTYHVRVAHRTGDNWNKQLPSATAVGETSVKIEMPSTQQAKALVEELFKLPPEKAGYDPSAGAAPYFDLLRDPVYLPILTPYAEKGSTQAAEGINSIASPEATRSLAHLMRSRPDLTFTIGMWMRNRLPDPYAKLNQRPPGQPETRLEAAQQRVRALSWRDDLRPEILDSARALLALDRVEAVRAVTFIEASLGGQSDLQRLAAAINRMIALRRKESDPQRAEILRWVPIELKQAATGIFERGILPGPSPRTAGERELFVAALERSLSFRPAGWIAVVTQMLGEDAPASRHTALESLTLSKGALPPELVKAVRQRLPKLIHDPDINVRTEAYFAMSLVGARDLATAAVDVVRTAKNEQLMQSAFGAAFRLGKGIDAIDGLLGRLTDDKMRLPAMQALSSLVEGTQGSGINSNLEPDQTQKLQRAWHQFAAAHSARVATGKLLHIGEPGVDASLYPSPFFDFRLADGRTWPPPAK